MKHIPVKIGLLKAGDPQWGPFAYDGMQQINGRPPEYEVSEWAKVTSIPESEEEGDPLGFVPETAHMIGESFEVLAVKIMIHPMKGRHFIYGLFYKFQGKVQYFWPWNLTKDTGR